MNKEISSILKAGIKAPSCDNNQPWKFKILSDNQVDLVNNKVDNDICGWGQRGALISHGALLENVQVKSKSLGYDVEIKLLPKEDEKELVASIFFKKGEPTKNNLEESINLRCSNRKKYSKKKLDENFFKSIELYNDEIDSTSVILTDKIEDIKKVGTIGGLNEKIMLENKILHDYFYSHITWNEEEDMVKRKFFIKTLELPSPAVFMLKKGERWSTLQKMNKFGFSKLVSSGNSKLYSASGAVGIVAIENLNKSSFIKAGMALERAWLRATKHGLSLQLISGVPLTYLSMKYGDAKTITQEEHKRALEEANHALKSIFLKGTPESYICLLFRLGYCTEPTSRTKRHELEKFIIS